MAWSREDVLVGGGGTLALAATAETAWALHDRFARDLAGLSALERAAAALWDFRPLAPALFAAGTTLVLLGAVLARPGRRREVVSVAVLRCLTLLASAFVALAAVILTAAAWITATGSIGQSDEPQFLYTGQERIVTLVTQALAYLPLAAFLSFVALYAARLQIDYEAEPPAPAERVPATTPLTDEMENLWREHLAFGPKRERARSLLSRIRTFEEAGDVTAARELADEMRRL